MSSELARPVIANSDEEIQPVAVPLDPDPPRLPAVDDGQYCTAYDCTRRVSDLSWERSAVRWRLHELDVKFTESNERTKVALEALEGTRHRLQTRALLVIHHSQTDKSASRHLHRDGARGSVVESRGPQGGEQ